VNDTRAQIGAAIQSGDTAAVLTLLDRLFRDAPSASNAAYVAAQYERLAPALSLVPFRLAILRTFTIEPIVPLLRARAFLAGIDLRLTIGDFNVIDQTLLDGASSLYTHEPDAVVVAALTADVAPALWSGGEQAEREAEELTARVSGWIDAFRSRSAASLIVHGFEQPAYAAAGAVLDGSDPRGQRQLLAEVNRSIVARAAGAPSVYVLDYDALVARAGRDAWRDPHKHLAMRVPMGPEAYGWLADEYLRFVIALAGRTCKVLALDLDNTLWGGVVGEDGLDHLQLGPEYPGSAYLELQRELKHLARRGVLLAVCSRNNPDEALYALRTHPEMLLRPDDFAAIHANWDDKASNLRRIAADLNVGLDAIAFLDDSPVEREWIRAELPDVRVLDVPADPVRYVDAIRRSPWFERLALSSEDRDRSRHYHDRRARADAQQAAASPEAFLASLGMRAQLGGVSRATIARLAQLTQKTNQFNLTTRRYTEAELERVAADPQAFVRSIRVTDRFGDNGIVGVAIGRVAGAICDVETFLLSCRVIGRAVETALLAEAVEQAAARGATRVTGWYLPTARNAPARDFYARHGFARAEERGEASRWELDITRAQVAAPPWIECHAEESIA
jgi:FkbH-like protein